ALLRRFKADGQPRHQRGGLLGAKRRSRMEGHVHLHRGSSQPGRGEKELGCAPYRPSVSTIRRSREASTGQEGQRVSGGRGVHASDRFFADEITPTTAG